MARTLVTGATGLLGSHLVRALADRGDELRLLIKRGSDTAALDGIDYEEVTGDVKDALDAFDGAADRAAVGDVAGHLLVVDPVQRCSVGAALDQQPELVAAIGEGQDEMRAEQAGGAGYQGPGHRSGW